MELGGSHDLATPRSSPGSRNPKECTLKTLYPKPEIPKTNPKPCALHPLATVGSKTLNGLLVLLGGSWCSLTNANCTYNCTYMHIGALEGLTSGL